MSEYIFELIGWINLHFGVAGRICALLIVVAVSIGILWLIQQLPITKGQPLCDYCIYENPNADSRAYHCPHYIKCRAFQVRAAKCPHINK